MANRAKPCVVVVGSLHYDIMVDAPYRPRQGETVTGRGWRPKFGGKGGNQAVAAARAGAAVRMAGAVGGDDFGRFMLASLAHNDVDHRHVARLRSAASGMSVAITDAEGEYGAVIVSGANLQIDPSALAGSDFWHDARALILQNEVPEAVNVAAARTARQMGALVCLNAAPFRVLSAELESVVDLMVVNAIEAEQLSGVKVSSLAAAAEAADILARRFPSVVVTVGGDGLVGMRRGEKGVKLAALPTVLVSTHGAGDVFVGSLVAALAGGAPFDAGLEAANAAAAAHVAKPAP